MRSFRDSHPEAFAALTSASPAVLLADLTDFAYDPTPRHVQYLSHRLALAATGNPRRLAIQEPPRHGKSEEVSHALPVWYLNRWPDRRVIIASHTAELSEHFGRKVRNTILANEDVLDVEIDPDSSAAGRWDTTKGGGLYAVGVGGAVVGRGGHLVIVDDPIKGTEAAYSKTQRDAVGRWWADDLVPRQEPGAVYVLMHQRWHRDDLLGRLLERERDRWDLVHLPALAGPNDLLGRAEGEALWPERWPLEALEEIRRGMTPHGWMAEYQQDPSAVDEGALIAREFLQLVDEPYPASCARVRFWDMAATKEAGCFTVGVLGARGHDGSVCVEDVERGQWGAGDVHNRILETARRDGPNVSVDWEIEPGSAGEQVAAALRNLLAGFATYGTRATGPKWVRAQPWASWARARKFYVLRRAWTETYVRELTTATPDLKGLMDQVDATSGMYAWIASRGHLNGEYAVGGASEAPREEMRGGFVPARPW